MRSRIAPPARFMQARSQDGPRRLPAKPLSQGITGAIILALGVPLTAGPIAYAIGRFVAMLAS